MSFSKTTGLIILCAEIQGVRMLKPKIIFFAVFMVFATLWRGWETFRKQGSTRGQTSMLWSFYLLFVMSVIIFLGTIVEFCLVPREFHWTPAIIGAELFLVANVIRMVAIRELGNFWSLHIEIRDQHQFVRTGIYGYIRHPAYLSFVLEHIAVTLAGNAWWALGLTLVVYVPLLVWRWRTEELALCAKFGESYRTYQREVGAWWPRCAARRQKL